MVKWLSLFSLKEAFRVRFPVGLRSVVSDGSQELSISP